MFLNPIIDRSIMRGGGGSLIDNLVAFYEFEEAAGADASDSHGNANDLVDNGTVQRGTGMQGNSAIMDIANARWLSMTSLNASHFELNEVTVALWMKITTLVTGPSKCYQRLFTHGGVWCGGVGYGAGIASDSGLAFSVTKGDNNTCLQHADRATGSWFFFAYMHDQANKTIRAWSSATGSLVEATNTYVWDPQLPPCAAVIDLGEGQGGVPTAGIVELDSLVVFDKALSQAEIELMYNSGNGLSYNDLAGLPSYYLMEDGSSYLMEDGSSKYILDG